MCTLFCFSSFFSSFYPHGFHASLFSCFLYFDRKNAHSVCFFHTYPPKNAIYPHLLVDNFPNAPMNIAFINMYGPLRKTRCPLVYDSYFCRNNLKTPPGFPGGAVLYRVKNCFCLGSFLEPYFCLSAAAAVSCPAAPFWFFPSAPAPSSTS